MLYWVLKLLVAEPLARLTMRPWLEGTEHIPTTGPALLVANHLHASETILVPAFLRRRLTFPAKAELFNGRSLPGRFLGWLLRGLRMVPMDRSGGRASSGSFQGLQQVFAAGEIVAIFPEGTRSADGRLYKGRTGAARMVLAANQGELKVPVIPVGVVNTVPRRTRFGFPWIWRPGVRVGAPLDFSAYAGAGNDRDTLRWITDECMNAIMELSGQTYADVYSTTFKEALAAGRPLEPATPPRPGFGKSKPPTPAKGAVAA